MRDPDVAPTVFASNAPGPEAPAPDAPGPDAGTSYERARRFEAGLSRAGLGLVPKLGRRASDAPLARLLRLLAHPDATLRDRPVVA